MAIGDQAGILPPSLETTDMKTATLVLALTLSLGAAPALAGSCADDIAKIDAALASGQVDPGQKDQVEDMRNQAVQLCGAGNEEEGQDVTAEAKALIGIE